jgi:histone deacetylase 1/2
LLILPILPTSSPLTPHPSTPPIHPLTSHATQLKKYNLDTDSPVFHDFFEYCQRYTGASLGCAYRINKKLSDIAINWSGGATHAKKTHAHGFNYINDVVLTIIELLKFHKRVLYIDLGITHGDGVEEAFYHTNRVFTLSLHKYGEFFPGTGHIDDIGVERGVNYSANIPLKSGLCDTQFITIFENVFPEIIKNFRPEVIVTSCGVDGLMGDRLGVWDLTSKAYIAAIQMIKSTLLPLVVFGGGGNTIHNVARCWTEITAILLDYQIEDIDGDSDDDGDGDDDDDDDDDDDENIPILPQTLPHTIYYEHYGPTYLLAVDDSGSDKKVTNLNDESELELIVQKVIKNVQNLQDLPTKIHSISLSDVSRDGFYQNEQNTQDDVIPMEELKINIEQLINDGTLSYL